MPTLNLLHSKDVHLNPFFFFCYYFFLNTFILKLKHNYIISPYLPSLQLVSHIPYPTLSLKLSPFNASCMYIILGLTIWH